MAQYSSRKEYIQYIENQYTHIFLKSKEVFNKGEGYFPNQVSQPARLFKPFPPFIKKASGSLVETVEGLTLVDFWQGHFSNILGHNHPILLDAMQSAIDHKLALQLGLLTELENELAFLLNKTTEFESFIFTTSGTLSTMYAIMLGLAHTKRHIVLKLEGGWHGAHPWSLVGVKYPEGPDKKVIEGAGLKKDWIKEIITVPINDIDSLQNIFKKHGGFKLLAQRAC